MNKKKILVLGAGGMAGSMIYNYLDSLDKYNMNCTSRAPIDNIFSIQIDIEKDMKVLERKIMESSPDTIINCIGILVKESEINPAKTIYTNSLFPHLLESITKDMPTKIIHLSTDCIFKGDITGKYSEDDLPTETNWYGRSKALGELKNGKDLTLRMSIIGPQLKNGTSLFHWIATTKEKILQGFDKVYWNGITTLELAKQIDRILDTNLTGIYHLVPEFCIPKGDLVRLINEIFDCKKLIESNNELRQNKVLANSRKEEYNPNIPEYRIQLEELKTWVSNG
jgi:dTDP-4-dehydrorhamnose reductase